jgi:hypothetical protein
MADTLTRPSSPSRGRTARGGSQLEHQPRPAVLVGLALAVWTAALGLAVLVCLTLTAWVTASHHDDAIKPAIATAIQAWLLAQHTSLSIVSAASGAELTLVPLGLTILLGALLVSGGRQAARLSGATDLFGAATSALALSLPYSVIAALLTRPAHLGQVRPSPLSALVGAFVLASICASVGALRETGQLRPMFERIPFEWRNALRAGVASSAIVVGLGAAVLVVGLTAHAGRAASLASSVHGGYSGVLLMALISVVFAPNAVLWSAAYLLGPGFAVGTQTSVSLTGVHLGGVPSVPLLAPLPASGSAPIASWVLVAGPIAAGVLAGWLLAKRNEVDAAPAEAAWWVRHRVVPSVWGLAAGGVAGLGLGVFAAMSAGSLGGGRMSVLGPVAGWVALAAALEIGVVASATSWVMGWRALRRAA